MKTIILTGGGTAGHVMVNLILIPHLLQSGYRIIYIGSHNGIEKELLSKIPEVDYYSISTGKLRRYFSLENFKDPFKVIKGIFEALHIIYKYKPHLIFSAGGFVSVPVVIAGWISRVPIIIRETDYTCGLANRIALRFAHQVCVTFPDTLKELPSYKRQYYGPIIRPELLKGDYSIGLTLTQFTGKKPIILVMGGSQGSHSTNQLIRTVLPELLSQFDIIHICGKGNVDESKSTSGYIQYEFVSEELTHLYAISDLIITRSGSNALFEGLLLKKPLLLLPLSKKYSRGDQILNAKYACSKGCAKIILEEDLTAIQLVEEIYHLYSNKHFYIKNLHALNYPDGLKKQLESIHKWVKS